MKKLRYEVSDLGMDNAQYFPGFDSSFSDFDSAVYGIGDTYNEALDDAIEMISQAEDLSQGAYDAIRRHAQMSEKQNARTSASAKQRIDTSHDISPNDYIDNDCDHEPGQFCEDCHEATVDSLLDEQSDSDNEYQYYVGIRYTVTTDKGE